MDKRLRKLERNVLQNPERGSTKMNVSDLPEAEQVLLEAARKLASNGLSYEECTPEQHAILNTAHRIMQFRVYDLFTTYLETMLCHEDKIAIITLHQRFLWFTHELIKEIQQQLEVSEIEKQVSEEDEVDRVDEYFRKAPPVFTPESYDNLMAELDREYFAKHKDELEQLVKRMEEKVKKHELARS